MVGVASCGGVSSCGILRHSVWSPYKKGDVEAIEKVQKRATKLVISLKNYHIQIV